MISINNAPTKKARIKQMEELAKKYLNYYELCGNKESNYFNNYYKKENELSMVGERHLTMACTETFE